MKAEPIKRSKHRYKIEHNKAKYSCKSHIWNDANRTKKRAVYNQEQIEERSFISVRAERKHLDLI